MCSVIATCHKTLCNGTQFVIYSVPTSFILQCITIVHTNSIQKHFIQVVGTSLPTSVLHNWFHNSSQYNNCNTNNDNVHFPHHFLQLVLQMLHPLVLTCCFILCGYTMLFSFKFLNRLIADLWLSSCPPIDPNIPSETYRIHTPLDSTKIQRKLNPRFDSNITNSTTYPISRAFKEAAPLVRCVLPDHAQLNHPCNLAIWAHNQREPSLFTDWMLPDFLPPHYPTRGRGLCPVRHCCGRVGLALG